MDITKFGSEETSETLRSRLGMDCMSGWLCCLDWPLYPVLRPYISMFSVVYLDDIWIFIKIIGVLTTIEDGIWSIEEWRIAHKLGEVGAIQSGAGVFEWTASKEGLHIDLESVKVIFDWSTLHKCHKAK